MDNELVSIIMPSYNVEKYIESSIKSVQSQTYDNWELIIIDDCSSDNTVKVIRKIQDSRIKLLLNKKNSGAALSRNRGLREAKGRWVAFLDADDFWHPEKLMLQLNFMKKYNYAFTYTDYKIRINGKDLPYIYTAPNKINKRKMYNYCYFSTITVIYDQTEVGLIQIADLKKNNDYAMWLQAVEKVVCYRYPKCLSCYVKHENSISSEKKWKLIKWHYLLFRLEANKTPVIAFLLTLNNLFYGIIKKIKYRKKIKKYVLKNNK